jgi:putative addiction module component (TIGR02574 family)
MQLTLQINEQKVDFFLELIRSFDFVTVVEDESNTELSEAHKAILDKRIASYTANPERLIPWSEVKKSIEAAL